MLYYREQEVKNILKSHVSKANSILALAQSNRFLEAFKTSWETVQYGSISSSLTGSVVAFDSTELKSEVDMWIRDLKDCKQQAENKFRSLEKPTYEEERKYANIVSDVTVLVDTYQDLKGKIDEIDQDFKNAVRVYRAPMREALTDISILYHSVNHVKGNFTGFKNVSVYVHGIEDTGNGFYRSVKQAAHPGDVIVRIRRDGTKEYVFIDKNGETVEKKTYEELVNIKGFNKNGRLHIVYDTEQKNEHRQETSDDLAEKLNEMGLMNENTKIDMFGHSYGGRRSLQFAMDYPDHVRSITTIGTPYDTNYLSTMANNVRWAAEKIGQDPKDTSDYLDFNEKNRNTNDGMEYSNAYTDMASEPMTEDIHHLKSANPEVYQQLLKMDITAAAGYRMEDTVSFSPYYTASGKHKISSDDTVSVESQNGEILGNLIDKKPQIEVEGSGVTNPGHIHEVKDEEFIHLIEKTNEKQRQ
ncbi:alpha/beta hydrolase [Bacillus haynesii]|uniref:alpha/beta fold hydrolase n=1 Tax=Bacillus haynesii TaxID=1925021 RepID=UPI0015937FE5|nr:alpha/beta hydrolase [Bacillus haynesii]MEC1417713.1 alpha/beta hydrolase [Bacillus haynesii]MEC1470122.1 alpha/beta hydrolase [Bacillus haynesii]NVB35061.1 alpha/beta fold hydrolase [Bacillus licheniformis]